MPWWLKLYERKWIDPASHEPTVCHTGRAEVEVHGFGIRNDCWCDVVHLIELAWKIEPQENSSLDTRQYFFKLKYKKSYHSNNTWKWWFVFCWSSRLTHRYLLVTRSFDVGFFLSWEWCTAGISPVEIFCRMGFWLLRFVVARIIRIRGNFCYENLLP